MSSTLSPDAPVVEQGKLLNMIMHQGMDKMTHKQFIVLKTFDYGDLLEEIRSQGHIKSEDVFVRLYNVLMEREIIEPIQSCILDIGVHGRSSKAVQEHYRHKLNSNSSLMKTLIHELEKILFTFDGPEGEIHLLKSGGVETLGHVLVSLEDGTGIYASTTLDLIGPGASDFPDLFEEEIKQALHGYLVDNHPGLSISMDIKIRRSELALATGDFLCSM